MQRRMLALFAGIAVGASALLGAAPASADHHVGGAPYVALGDSEAAGTGNLPYLDPGCLRSARAYPEHLGAMLGGVASSACAGASTDDLLTQQLGDLGPSTQLVTITVGINNADWQRVLLACASGDLADPACATAYGQAQAAYATLPWDIATVVGTVRSLAQNSAILVTGYPELFGDVTTSCSVGAYQGTPIRVTAAAAWAIDDAITQVNGAIAYGEWLTGDPNAHFIPVADAFDGHGLCDTDDRWISGLVGGQATWQRSFHPNAAGQQAYATILAGYLPH